MPGSALERVVRRASRQREEARERCGLCASPVSDEHRHVLDARSDQLLCCCYACSVLFNRGAASDGHYRLVPQRRVPLRDVTPAALGVPVGVAFFVRHADGEISAHYPSPAGATRWDVDGDAWRKVVAACPDLGGMESEVEALLVNTARGRSEAWLVPLDDCYRLVAIVRTHWRGLYGGDQVWPEIQNFFEGLRSTVSA